MITLYGAGPRWGLPDASPFVMKTEIQLKMAGLAYRLDTNGFAAAPLGKVPYIDDAGVIVPDSTFIRRHVERKYGFDFDGGLTRDDRAVAWSIERMLEDHLYWAMVYFRWAYDENFWAGPASFFKGMPEAEVEAIRGGVVEKIRGHGIGLHPLEDVARLGAESLDALAILLGDGPFLFGERPSGADATAFAMVAGVFCPVFDSPLRDAAESLPELRQYRTRMMERYYPEPAMADAT